MSLTADIHGIIMEMLALPSTFGIPVTSALGNAAASSMSVGALESDSLAFTFLFIVHCCRSFQ